MSLHDELARCAKQHSARVAFQHTFFLRWLCIVPDVQWQPANNLLIFLLEPLTISACELRLGTV